MRDTNTDDRIAVIAALAERWPSGHLGRTALMKCAYFLQTVKHVPLGYKFRLYSYGPYSTTVLDDLDAAEVRGEVEVKTVQFPGGYGYDIRRKEAGHPQRGTFAKQYERDLDWLIEHFGSHTAAELELDATILYTFRECGTPDEDLIVQRVNEVKPHFPLERIRERYKFLKQTDLLVK